MDVNKDIFNAISDNDVNKVLNLLNSVHSQVDINKQDVHHGLQTILMRICHMHITSDQRTSILDEIPPWKPDLNIQDGTGRSVLCHACIAEKTEVLLWLHQQDGLDADLADNDGNTALIYAVRSGNADLVQTLLSSFQSINSNHKNVKGEWTFGIVLYHK